ncbi:MAG: tetratricopeptide repeat protein [Bacteroidota bacterium]
MLLARHLLLLLCWLIVSSLSAQDSLRIDSLESFIREDIHDSVKFRLLLEIASEIQASDTLKSFDYLEEGRLIAESVNDTRNLGLYHKTLGKTRTACGDYKLAIMNYDRALAYFNEAEDLKNYYETVKEKGNAYYYQSDYNQAIKLYTTALDFYKQNSMTLGITRCLNNLGLIHKNRGDYVEALSAYEESIFHLDTVKNAYDISQAYINMGNVFVFLGSYDRALEYFHKALIISEREGFQQNISLSLSNSGVVQNKIHNYEEADRLYRRSLIVSQAINDPVQVSNCLINIGTNYADMGEPGKGLDFVERGLAFKEELEDQRRISNCYIHLARIYHMMEEPDKALIYFDKAIPVKEQLGDQEGMVRCYLGLGSVMLDRKQYGGARQMTDAALEIATEIHTMEHIAEALEIKRQIAVTRGDYRSAYRYAMDYNLYKDSLVDEATYRAGMELEFRYRSKVLEQENENLRIQASLDQALMRRRATILNTILGLASLLAIGLLLVVYFMRKLRNTSLKLEEQNLVIIKQNLKLDQLNRTKDRMMSIIAHDLRGTIGNQLTAVEVLHKIEIEGNSEIDRRKLLGNLKNSASYSLELLENLLHWSRLEEQESYYHPEKINLNPLIMSCLELHEEAATNKELCIHYEIPEELTCGADRIMMEVIFRNLISNAIKFTNRGGNITISSGQKDGLIYFKVSDQGIGMSPEQIDKVLNNGGFTRRGTDNEKGAGMGLTLVREFTSIHKGELKISSKPDKGSVFEVIIPCRN